MNTMNAENDLKGFAASVYRIIEEKANSNSLIQGLTGIVGFPLTLLADGAVVFTHYGAMINEIRGLRGYGPVTVDILEPIVRSISGEILFDLVTDKVLGQIPIIGIYFNAICARTMTWRLGILFAMLAWRGEAMEQSDMKDAARTIRTAFPQSDAMSFKQPDYPTFERLLMSV